MLHYTNLFSKIIGMYFKQADKNIEKLNDLTLMGHVEALKLLHPTKHRSSFSELDLWLSKYNDQYEAKEFTSLL